MPQTCRALLSRRPSATAHRLRGSLLRSLWLAALWMALPSLAADAPPLTAETYARAEAVLPQNVGRLIRQSTVQPQWIGDGPAFWFEHDGPDGKSYERVDPGQRSRGPLFDHAALARQLSDRLGRPVSASDLGLQALKLDPQAAMLRFRHAGEAWVWRLADNALQRETEQAKPAMELGVESPDGAWRVVVRAHDLYLIGVRDGSERRLTTDGSVDAPYARPVVNVKAMIAAGHDRPPLAPDVSWAPDSSRFATYRMRLGASRTLALVQSSPEGEAYPRVFGYRYPMTGDRDVPVAEELVFTVADARRIPLLTPPEPVLYYGGPDFTWSKDSRRLFRVIVERGYRTHALFRVDADTGEAAVLARDEAAPYVDIYDHLWAYDAQADRHYWKTQASGCGLLDVIGSTRATRRGFTRGCWNARRVLGYDPKHPAVFVLGSGREGDRDPYYSTLYRVPSKGGTPVLLTPEPVEHTVWLSPDGQWFIDNMSKIDSPTRTVVRSARDGLIVMELSRADVSAYRSAGHDLPEPFTATAADGRTRLYGAVYRPAGFDAQQRYPVIEYIYTGPHTFTTPKSFHAALFGRNANALAQLGFFVVIVDGRGSASRDRAFKLPAYRNLHAVGLDDHVAAIRQLARRYPQMDLDRVGIYGFSAGGYDVVRAMTERPDFYKAGVAASGNHDNRLDKAVWNEQWMGSDLDPAFDANSNATWAGKLQGALMLAHGELDENVPPAATMRLVAALIAANKDFELLIVPNGDHFLDESPYFNRKRWDFFVRTLQERAPPENYRIAPFPR